MHLYIYSSFGLNVEYKTIRLVLFRAIIKISFRSWLWKSETQCTSSSVWIRKTTKQSKIGKAMETSIIKHWVYGGDLGEKCVEETLNELWDINITVKESMNLWFMVLREYRQLFQRFMRYSVRHTKGARFSSAEKINIKRETPLLLYVIIIIMIIIICYQQEIENKKQNNNSQPSRREHQRNFHSFSLMCSSGNGFSFESIRGNIIHLSFLLFFLTILCSIFNYNLDSR